MKFRHFFTSVLTAATLAAASPAQAYEPVIDEVPSAEAMTFDLFIVRPLGLVGTVAGIVVYVVALPINLLTFNLADPARKLIIQPINFTFTRDLGALD